MSHDELPYQLAAVLGKPICAILPAKANLFVKTITQMGIKKVRIKDSKLLGWMKTDQESSVYSIMHADFKNTIGRNVNLEFILSDDKVRLLKQVKGNHTLLFYDHNMNELFVTNGDLNFLLMKPGNRSFNLQIPTFELNSISRIHTDKAAHIKSLMRSSKYVEILIYNHNIASVCIPGLININFEPLATPDFIRNLPDLRLRAYNFLYISGPEVLLEVGKSAKHYWLHTSINITDQQSISQYERLIEV